MSLCENPYMRGSLPCPCQKCDPCLRTRRNTWSNRISLESYSHENSAFITLTYDDDHLQFGHPETGEWLPHPTLNPKDLQNFIKRIRRAVAPQRLRFYAVGEYGDRSWRPHYHLALFGYESCWRGETRKDKHAQSLPCCPPCDLIKEKWTYGGIDNALVEDKSATYIAGYVTKKLTKKDDEKLYGRYPEFSRMSRRPGIGALNMDHLATALNSEHGHHCLTEHGDVPITIKIGTKTLLLGRYLRDQLRNLTELNEYVNLETGEIIDPKELSKNEYLQEMHTMFKDYLNDPKTPNEKKISLKHFIQDRDAQKILNQKTKHNLIKKEKKI